MLGMKIALTLLMVCIVERASTAEFGVFIGKEKASEFLNRDRRSVSDGWTDVQRANFESECIEEQCSIEETREIFPGDEFEKNAAWNSLWNKCTDDPTACSSPGTENCTNMYNSVECQCTQGYIGSKCNIDVDECELNFALCDWPKYCVNTFGAYDCACKEGWTGENCEIDVNECEQPETACKSGGTCVNLPGTFYCRCEPGSDQFTCSPALNECTKSNPCQNNAMCVEFSNDYSCLCTSGWDGQHCDERYE